MLKILDVVLFGVFEVGFGVIFDREDTECSTFVAMKVINSVPVFFLQGAVLRGWRVLSFCRVCFCFPFRGACYLDELCS